MSHKPKRVHTLSLVVGLCFVAATVQAESPPSLPDCASNPTCESIFLQARAQSEQGHSREALQLYKAAYEVRADPRILFNIARILQKQGDAGQAKIYYRRFIESPFDRADLKAKAQEYLTQLDSVGSSVPVNADGAQRTVPVYKRAWFWAVIGSSVVAVGLGVGLGVGFSNRTPTLPSGVNTYVPTF